jgi:hypothetical protein
MLVNSSKGESGSRGPVGPFEPAALTGAGGPAITPRRCQTVPEDPCGAAWPLAARSRRQRDPRRSGGRHYRRVQVI